MNRLLALLGLTLLAPLAPAQTPSPQPGQVVASGTVPDEATRASVLARLRELYGHERVVDQISVGQVAIPANWNAHVQKLLTPQLKQISAGQLKIDGTTVSLSGDVANEAQRQKIASDVATSLNPTYTVNNGLRVAGGDQVLLDRTLGDRIVEFDSGKATLTAAGLAILDDMIKTMEKLKERKVAIIGHTDNQGSPSANQELSQARAEAVKAYLSSRGISAALLTASGQGADRPIAGNDTPAGRARNRRIEFRIEP